MSTETEVGRLFFQLKAALSRHTGFESVDSTLTSTGVRLLGRVPPKSMADWKTFVEMVLVSETDAPWSVDISKKYFLKAGALVFGWRLQFKCEDSAGALRQLLSLLENNPGVPAPSYDDLEVPLLSGKDTRGVAGLLGKVAVGPGAARSR